MAVHAAVQQHTRALSSSRPWYQGPKELQSFFHTHFYICIWGPVLRVFSSVAALQAMQSPRDTVVKVDRQTGNDKKTCLSRPLGCTQLGEIARLGTWEVGSNFQNESWDSFWKFGPILGG